MYVVELEEMLDMWPSLATLTRNEPPLGWGLLHNALVLNTPIRLIRKIISLSSTDVINTPINGKFPIHLAVNNKPNLACIEMLLKKKAEANGRTGDGFTPLDIAVKTQSPALAQKMKSLGCSFNKCSWQDSFSIH